MNRDTEVCIIGAGFAGLVASLLCCQRQMRCVVIEKRSRDAGSVSNAHYLNAYTLEILVSVGLSIEALRAAAVDASIDKTMVVCHTLNRTLAKIDLHSDPTFSHRFAAAGRYGAFLNIRASRLHHLLLSLVESKGIEIRWSYGITALDSQQQRVKVQPAHGQAYWLPCNTVLACDGASSHTVQMANIEHRHRTFYRYFFTIECHGSIRSVVQDQAVMYWIYHERLLGCMINFDLDALQVIQIPVLTKEAINWTDKDIKQRFSAICGIPVDACQHRFRVCGHWRLETSLLSEASQDHWLFVCGDALHQVLPAGGLGLNLALADVFNLIWKLPRQQKASRAMLATYQTERIAVADRALQQSVDNYHRFIAMSETFLSGVGTGGLDGLLRSVPPSIRSSVVDAWLWLNRASHDLDLMPVDAWSEVMQHNRGHFDGMAMHFSAPYLSSLVFEPSQRVLYALDSMRHRLFVGYRLMNFQCVIDRQVVTLGDVLDYDRWTFVVGQTSRVFMRHYRSFGLPKQLLQVDFDLALDLALDQCLPMQQGDCLLIRPDRYVAAFISMNDHERLERFGAFLRHITTV
jgi:2-polyprenyl-6-methoxyphenol hydroxylase-like FAD-dependent oxidoreductase